MAGTKTDVDVLDTLDSPPPEEMDAAFAAYIEVGIIRSGVHSNGVHWNLRILPQGPEFALMSYTLGDAPLFALSTEGKALLDEQMWKMSREWPDSLAFHYGEIGFLGIAPRKDALTILGLLDYVFENKCLVFRRSSTGIQHARPRLNPWSPSGMPVREPE